MKHKIRTPHQPNPVRVVTERQLQDLKHAGLVKEYIEKVPENEAEEQELAKPKPAPKRRAPAPKAKAKPPVQTSEVKPSELKLPPPVGGDNKEN